MSLGSCVGRLGHVIRLRQHIERGLRHPLVGPLLLLLLAVLVVFTALHETSESIFGEAGLVCVAIALVLLAVVPFAGRRPVPARLAATNPSRGPPIENRRLRVPGIYVLDFRPLRL